jgi:DNA excision repair protein ERCC-4
MRRTLVLADVQERASGVPAALARLGVDVQVAALRAGDYAGGSEWLVERKTVRDFHLSVIAGRFWAQVGKLRRSPARDVLLIEGANIDAGRLSPSSVRGIRVALFELGVSIIRSRDVSDTASWLQRLAIRSGLPRGRSVRTIPDQRPNERLAIAPQAMLAAVPGISTTIARALLSHFGSAAAVARADIEELKAVRGMGSKPAAARLASFRSDYRP